MTTYSDYSASKEAPVGDSFLLWDEFLTPQESPITSPRTCEYGPGSLTIQDTQPYVSLAYGKLIISGVKTNYVDPQIIFPSSYSRVAGLSFFMVAGRPVSTTNLWLFGFENYINLSNNNATARVGNLDRVGTPISANVYYDFAVILRSSGAFYLIRGGAYSVWTIFWIDNFHNSATVTPFIYPEGAASTNKINIDSIRLFSMATPWDTNYGISTNRVASPSINEIIISNSDAIIEMTWTVVTGDTWNLMVRRTDDDNCDIIRVSQTGGTIKYIEKVTGVETERSSVSQSLGNGTVQRVVVILNGAVKKVAVGGILKIIYSTAGVNLGTSVKTNKAGTDLIAWPLTITGTALTELNRWIA